MTGSPPPLIRREALLLGVAIAGVVLIMLAIASATNGSRYLFSSDAVYSYRVGIDPFGNGASFHGLRADAGIAYRYGRILYPIVAWILALGRPRAVVWTMPVVYAAGVGAMVACAAELVARRGSPAVRGAFVMLAPAMWLTLPIVFADPFVVALILSIFVFEGAGRRTSAAIVAALALLARESAGFALVPFVLRDIRRRDVRGVAGWILSCVPLIGWWTWVRFRIGTWPLLDPSVGRRQALSAPVEGLLSVMREGRPLSGWLLFAVALGSATFAAAIVVAVRRPWFPVTWAGAIFGAMLLCLGPAALRLPAQSVRLMLPAHVLIVLGIVAPRTTRAPEVEERAHA